MNKIYTINPEFPFCEISSDGDIATISSSGKPYKKYRKTFPNRAGYRRLRVKQFNDEYCNILVSRLVFFSFLPKYKNDLFYDVHHRNWVRNDNKLANLSLIIKGWHKKLRPPKRFVLEEIFINFDIIDKSECSGIISLDEFLKYIHFGCQETTCIPNADSNRKLYLLEEIYLDFMNVNIDDFSGILPISILQKQIYYIDKRYEEIIKDAVISAEQLEHENYLVEII